MRPLLVGEASPHGLGPLWVEPLNSAGARLARILGLSAEEYLARFRRANLFESPPARWSAAEARAAAAALRAHGPLVLLGCRVSAAFGHEYRPFELVGDGVLVLPHPSGLCRTWNDPASARLARVSVSALCRR